MNNKKLSFALAQIFLVISLSFTVAAEMSTYDLTYDENGNLQQAFDQHIEYNQFNQVSKVRSGNSTGDIIEQYIYDQDGQRLKKIEPQLNQTTYYLTDTFIKVVNDTGTYNSVYYYQDDVLVGRKDSDGRKYLYHPDHLGSTDLVTDESQNIIEETTYKPFGEVIDDGASRYLHGAKELDSTNMYYYGARYYDPFCRCFVSPDPNIPDVYNSQALNRYSFVYNNPYKYVDPTGERAELVFRGVNVNYNPLFPLESAILRYSVATNYAHSYFDITPDNPADFGGETNFQLGAGPTLKNGNPVLRSNNQQLTSTPEYSRTTLVTPQGKTDTQFIQNLQIEATKINQANIPYNPFPDNKPGTANSNTFTTTIIERSGSNVPTANLPKGVTAPGYGQAYKPSASTTNQNRASQGTRQSAFRNFFNKVKSRFSGRNRR